MKHQVANTKKAFEKEKRSSMDHCQALVRIAAPGILGPGCHFKTLHPFFSLKFSCRFEGMRRNLSFIDVTWKTSDPADPPETHLICIHLPN